ncbi:hypothetical protein [Microcoleus sp. A6-C5]|uniref:hypothetical protein n=1 Tax=Microcoleus sp. A6-C5 TaxID=2818547 RepID=UPI002FD1EE27
MQNDFEIAGQLNLLWEKISEGITEANKVLEQVRKVELDVSSAEKANAEIAEVIEVETSRAKSEFELEISRAKSEFELEISRAISEVQPEISRAETAKAEIAKVIEAQISRVETAKAEIAAFESLIKEIGGSAGLKKLCHELQEGREVAFKLETYHQQENQKLLLEKMAQQQQQFIRQGKLEQENQRVHLTLANTSN